MMSNNAAQKSLHSLADAANAASASSAAAAVPAQPLLTRSKSAQLPKSLAAFGPFSEGSER